MVHYLYNNNIMASQDKTSPPPTVIILDETKKVAIIDVPVTSKQQQLPANSYVKDLHKALKEKGFEIDAKRVKDNWRWFNDKIYRPVETVYLKLPAQITKVKRPYLLYRESNRMLFLTGLTLLVAGISRSQGQTYMKTFRNVVLSFYGFGLLIAPEVYNPFMRKELR